jgi:hypothetical protein
MVKKIPKNKWFIVGLGSVTGLANYLHKKATDVNTKQMFDLPIIDLNAKRLSNMFN